MQREKGPPTRRLHTERAAFSLTCRSAGTSELAFSIGVLVTIAFEFLNGVALLIDILFDRRSCGVSSIVGPLGRVARASRELANVHQFFVSWHFICFLVLF